MAWTEMKKRVAVVDDSAELAEMISEYLHSKGLDAEPISELADLDMECAYDAYIMDWTMGSYTTGPTVWELLKRYPESPVILLTGTTRFSDAGFSKAIESGRVIHIEKPATMRSVLDKLLKAWELQKAHGSNTPESM